MKNSSEWIFDIHEKVNAKYAKKRKMRKVLSRTATLSAVLILVVTGIIAFPSLIHNPGVQNAMNHRPPNISYNHIDYDISGITGDDPNKFVGDYLGSVNGYFVDDGSGNEPLEKDNLYRVTGLNPNFVICAKTSKGWEFFINRSFDSGTEDYEKSGLMNLMNQDVSASYYLDAIDAQSAYNQPHKSLNLTKSESQSLFKFIFMQTDSDILAGPYKFVFNMEFKLNNGTTVTLHLLEHGEVSFVEFEGHEAKLNNTFKQMLENYCPNANAKLNGKANE